MKRIVKIYISFVLIFIMMGYAIIPVFADGILYKIDSPLSNIHAQVLNNTSTKYYSR